ncbi:vesicle-trafficking protein SEC22c isoform X7 [Rattus norvegicus]|uniref:vesicle-trafficking protein SEC22c isoform X7 n=1 Tax=Rattus norvegicus TaxID=10116 RepID=UPI002FD80D08
MATPQRTLNLTRGAILEVPTLLVCLRHFTVVSLTLLSRGLTAPNLRMKPVTALGVLSLVLNIMCAALNLIRGVHLAEHSLQVAQEEVGNILAFFIPSVACIVQCYLYLFYSPTRTLKVLLMLASICLGNAYLHGLRNTWQILFHVGVAFLSSYQILTRQLQERQSDYGV